VIRPGKSARLAQGTIRRRELAFPCFRAPNNSRRRGGRGIATGTIANTGTGTTTSGAYRIELRDAAGRLWKTGHVEGFPRKRLLAWDLLYRALEKLVGNRNRHV
jgi:hypothetical protein